MNVALLGAKRFIQYSNGEDFSLAEVPGMAIELANADGNGIEEALPLLNEILQSQIGAPDLGGKSAMSAGINLISNAAIRLGGNNDAGRDVLTDIIKNKFDINTLMPLVMSCDPKDMHEEVGVDKAECFVQNLPPLVRAATEAAASFLGDRKTPNLVHHFTDEAEESVAYDQADRDEKNELKIY